MLFLACQQTRKSLACLWYNKASAKLNFPGGTTMETAEDVPVFEHSPDHPIPSDVTRGANWFFWTAIFSVIASTVHYFGNDYLFFLSFSVSQLVNGLPMGWINVDSVPYPPLTALIINILAAAIFAVFGFFARQRSSWAFLIGFFLYMFDAILCIGFKDLYSFAFHMLVIFFLFKGLVATRRLYQGV